MRYLFILIAFLCASCGTALPTIKPYKLDVQQGNVVTSKMLLQLRPGMTKSQVRFIMGTPLIQDSFHGNRWDYVYQMREAGKITEQRRVILDFENELLKTVRGDVIPASGDQTKLNESEAKSGTRVVLPAKKQEEKSFFSRLRFWEKDDADIAKAAAEKEAALKAKADADEAAKKSAAVIKQKAAPVVTVPDVKPAAPIVVPASVLPETPAPAPSSKPLSVSPAAVPAPKVEVTAVAPSGTLKSKGVDEVPVDAAVLAETPVKASSYDSKSGMMFDKNLRFASEEVELVSKPVVTPRAGNKVPPKPKDLPAESSPSFFDRMLEKIGF